jgi:hypothetical protein
MEATMALGLQTESNGGGDFLPIVKYDARAGRFFRVDRSQVGDTWETNPVDITNGFQAVFGLQDIKVGYINFNTGGAPDFQLVGLGDKLPAKPSDLHKQGFRLNVKLGKSSGGDVRDFASCARVVIGALDELHTLYEAKKGDNRGKLPIVALKTTTAVKSGQGAKTSTNYAPVFEIVKWVDAPPELIGGAKAKEPEKVAPKEGPKAPPADDGLDEF